MKKIRYGVKLLAALLVLLLLVGCGAAAGPAAETAVPEQSAAPEAVTAPAAPETAPAEEETGPVVHVSTVDELLAAIAPDTTIELAAGEYALYRASNYGGLSGSEYYEWTRGYDGPALEIHGANGLVLRGAGADAVTITAEPRFANVLTFKGCESLTLEGLTVGHTSEPGVCSGGVLRLEDCRGCTVRQCGLFGCGTVGVEAVNCSGLSVEDSSVYECSSFALSLSACRNVSVIGGEVYGCGRREGLGGGMSLFSLHDCGGVTIASVRVHDNTAELLLDSVGSRNVRLLSSEVKGNAFTGFFRLSRFGAAVDGCRFEGNSSLSWYWDSSAFAADLSGQQLDDAALAAMKLREIDLDAFPVDGGGAVFEEVQAAPGEEIRVTTVDEFIAAIGPERTIVLDGELFDLSAVSGSAAQDGSYYYWEETYDGAELVIDGVSNLTIRAGTDDAKAVTISAVPRYANVLTFRGCENITLEGFTAGHTKEPGLCAGGVLYFELCRHVTVDGCRLYGCGILGVQGVYCSDLLVRGTEIFECSQGGALMDGCDRVAFEGCSVRDVPSPALCLTASEDVSWNGTPLTGFYYDLENGLPVEPDWSGAVG